MIIVRSTWNTKCTLCPNCSFLLSRGSLYCFSNILPTYDATGHVLLSLTTFGPSCFKNKTIWNVDHRVMLLIDSGRYKFSGNLSFRLFVEVSKLCGIWNNAYMMLFLMHSVVTQSWMASKEHDGLGRVLNSLAVISSSDLVHCKVTWSHHPLLSVALEFWALH